MKHEDINAICRLRKKKGKLIQEICKINGEINHYNCDHTLPNGETAITTTNRKCSICGTPLKCQMCGCDITPENLIEKLGYCGECYKSTIYARWE